MCTIHRPHLIRKRHNTCKPSFVSEVNSPGHQMRSYLDKSVTSCWLLVMLTGLWNLFQNDKYNPHQCLLLKCLILSVLDCNYVQLKYCILNMQYKEYVKLVAAGNCQTDKWMIGNWRHCQWLDWNGLVKRLYSLHFILKYLVMAICAL